MMLNLEIKTTSKKYKRRAFTLIELVVVIAIIAVLTASLTPKLSGYIEEARKVVVLEQAKRVLTAYESTKLKANSLTESSSITSVINSSGGLITKDEITKIPEGFTIAQCRKLVNTEKFDFTMDNGVVSKINQIK